jgi:hypothetical protein
MSMAPAEKVVSLEYLAENNAPAVVESAEGEPTAVVTAPDEGADGGSES